MIYTKRNEIRKLIEIKESEVDHFQNERHMRGFRKSEINYDKQNYNRNLLKTKQVITIRVIKRLSNVTEITKYLMHKVIDRKEVTKLQLRG